MIGEVRGDTSRWPQNAAIYLPERRAAEAGQALLPDRSRKLDPVHGGPGNAPRKGGRAAGLKAARDAFYRGDIAQKIVAYHKANDGWMREDDLAEFHVDVETPLHVRFGDVDGARLPAVVPGAGAAADAEHPRRHRSDVRWATTRRPISIRWSRR